MMMAAPMSEALARRPVPRLRRVIKKISSTKNIGKVLPVGVPY
uniref:Uncharacterized protein n=1 Tax=Romanomermis culicivorax TaxID=13658 RepID=A0A915LAF9_ROMCU